MSPMASQMTGVPIVYSTVCSGANQRKHQNSSPLAFLRGIHRSPVNSPQRDSNAENVFLWWSHHVNMTVNLTSMFPAERNRIGMTRWTPRLLVSWAPSQYQKRRLFVRSRKVSKPRDWYFKSSYRFEIWQAHRQHGCRSACQISERSDNSKYKSRGFETLRDLTKRRLLGYWEGALVPCVARLLIAMVMSRQDNRVLVYQEWNFEKCMPFQGSEIIEIYLFVFLKIHLAP